MRDTPSVPVKEAQVSVQEAERVYQEALRRYVAARDEMSRFYSTYIAPYQPSRPPTGLVPEGLAEEVVARLDETHAAFDSARLTLTERRSRAA
jgi:hypothetical protein